MRKSASSTSNNGRRQQKTIVSNDRGYPRPQLERDQWINLNGQWDFSIDAAGEVADFSKVDWNASILVPFAPETPASGIGNTGFFDVVWYRRHFETPKL